MTGISAMKAAVDSALASAAHITEIEIHNNRLSPNPMEPRAALGIYDGAEDHYTCYTTSQNPHAARLVMSAFYKCRAGKQAARHRPDVGGGFGLEDLYISGRNHLPLGLEEDRRTGQVDRPTALKPSSPTRMAATMSPR